MDFVFFLNSILLGVALAMDAFSVSCANGLNEPAMRKNRMCLIAGTFGFFQIIMPLIGWFLVTAACDIFHSLENLIPWAALILLLFLGGKMLIDGIKKKSGDESVAVGLGALILQGIATSIDALSVGFTISSLSLFEALIETAIIGAVTFIICIIGLLIGRKFGTALSGKASILGGVILIAIGIEIFIKGIL